jgi:hypothetical protein
MTILIAPQSHIDSSQIISLGQRLNVPVISIAPPNDRQMIRDGKCYLFLLFMPTQNLIHQKIHST